MKQRSVRAELFRPGPNKSFLGPTRPGVNVKDSARARPKFSKLHFWPDPARFEKKIFSPAQPVQKICKIRPGPTRYTKVDCQAQSWSSIQKVALEQCRLLIQTHDFPTIKCKETVCRLPTLLIVKHLKNSQPEKKISTPGPGKQKKN